jgi:hypothetical protein
VVTARRRGLQPDLAAIAQPFDDSMENAITIAWWQCGRFAATPRL